MSSPNELGDPLRYQDTIYAASPSVYWRLSETLGSVAADDESTDNGTYALSQAQDANHWAIGQGEASTGN